MFTADNMRYLLELSRTGRLADAAKRLGVDHTTVSRRITRLEKDTGTRLFDRGVSGGWQLTEAGRRLVPPHAEAVESAVLAALDETSSLGGLTGTVRIITPDGFGSFVLVPGLAALRSEHPPGLFTELVTSTTHDLLTGRDFDIAVTLERPSPRSVVVRKLAEYDLRLYASRGGYLDQHDPISSLEDLRHHTLIWYVDAFLDVEPLRILDSLIPDFQAQIQTNNIAGHYQAVKHGVGGIAPLPSYIGALDEDLVPVLRDDFIAHRTYWLVVPRELTRLARVKAITEALYSIVDGNPELRGEVG